MHHNTTAPVEVQPGVIQDLTFYTAGLKDIPAVFFYLLISVVMLSGLSGLGRGPPPPGEHPQRGLSLGGIPSQ